MSLFKINPLSIIIASGILVASNASAALVGDQTATMTFGTVPSSVSGWANESLSSGGACQNGACYIQNGIAAGIVKDPIDNIAHFHRPPLVSGAAVAAQYHPDSTGIYIRLSDLTNFSLQSIDIDTSHGVSGGSFVMYAYSNAINPGILSENGDYVDGADNVAKFAPSDPEGGLIPYKASFVVANDGAKSTFTLSDLGAAWSNIGAFWITFQGFNHSPAQSYPATSYNEATEVAIYPYPSFELRVDNVKLAAPVPVPAAVWLFGTGLMGLFARSRKVTA